MPDTQCKNFMTHSLNSCRQPLHSTTTACSTSRVDNNNILVHQYTENMLLNLGVIFFIHRFITFMHATFNFRGGPLMKSYCSKPIIIHQNKSTSFKFTSGESAYTKTLGR